MLYYYHTANGKARLNKGDKHKIINLGDYRNETDAKAACVRHYEKACKAARNFDRPEPTALYL